MNKLGIGYIACESDDMVSQSFPTIPTGFGEVVVVNSGSKLSDSVFKGADKIISYSEPLTNAIAKNKALRHLMTQGCEHIFLMDSAVKIHDADVFRQYVITAQESGIWHLNYALQGPLNRAQSDTTDISSIKGLMELNRSSTPAPRVKLKYQTVKVSFYTHFVSGFSYFYRGVVKNIGYFDERYVNTLEDLDYTNRCIQKGLHPPYWWFADIENSDDYLKYQYDDAVTVSGDEQKEMGFAKSWFKNKFDCSPELISDVGEHVALKTVNKLRNNYAKKVLQ